MCRLLAFTSATPASFAAAVGAPTLREFLDLSRVHRDGWGVSWLESGGLQTLKTATRADEALTASLEDVRSSAAIAHLRWATPGLSVNLENTHPFVADGLSFAHNGSIAPRELLLAQATDRLDLAGTTDSEVYFRLFQQLWAAQGGTAAEAAAALLARLRPLFPSSSFNALILTPDELVAVNASAAAKLTPELYAECVQHNLSSEHNDDYFQLRIARTPEGQTVIGSTGFGTLAWEPLPPESITSIDLVDHQIRTVPISAPQSGLRAG